MNMSDIINGLKKVVKPKVQDLSEAEIEAERMRYWKCAKCNVINEIEEKMCSKCYADRPPKYEHPSRDEILKFLKKSWDSIPFYLGLAFLVTAIFIYIRSSLSISIETIDLVVVGIFLVPAILLFIYGVYRKLTGR